jgi:hypothetical protein
VRNFAEKECKQHASQNQKADCYESYTRDKWGVHVGARLTYQRMPRDGLARDVPCTDPVKPERRLLALVRLDHDWRRFLKCTIVTISIRSDVIL